MKKNVQHIYIYIYIKDKYNVCKNGHKTGVQEAKRSKLLKQQGGKHSPLQGHVFLPLIYRILKKKTTFFPHFLSWLTNGTRSYKASPEKHKDDQRWSRGQKESIKKHEYNETRCYGWKDNRKMQNMWKKNACKRVSTDREVVKMLSRENPKILMDRGFVKNLSSRQRA